MFLSHRLRNQADLVKCCTYCPEYICHRVICFPPHLNSASTLGYLVKLKSRVFVKILILEKRNSRNFTYWLWFYLLKKDAAFWLWHHVMENLKRKTRTKLCQNRPRFVKDMTKHFSVFFRFTVYIRFHTDSNRLESNNFCVHGKLTRISVRPLLDIALLLLLSSYSRVRAGHRCGASCWTKFLYSWSDAWSFIITVLCFRSIFSSLYISHRLTL